MNILGASADGVISAVETSMKRLRPILLKDGIKNDTGFFALRCTMLGELILLARIGIMPPNKYEKYLAFSLEKGLRLFAHLPQHKSSWQSRDNVKFWGGAIVSKSLILSFSGLPELADEALMLDASVGLGWLSPGEANEIVNISANNYYPRVNS